MTRAIAMFLVACTCVLAACGDDSAPELAELPPIPTLNDDSSCTAWRQSPRENKRAYVARVTPRYLDSPDDDEIDLVMAKVQELCDVAGSAKVESSTLSELVAAEAPQARLTPRSTCSAWNEISEPIRRRFLLQRMDRLVRNPREAEIAEVQSELDELCAGSAGSQLLEAIALYSSRARLVHTAKCSVWVAASQRARDAYTRRTLPRYLPDAQPDDVAAVTRGVDGACEDIVTNNRPSYAIVEYLAAEARSRSLVG